MSQDPKTYFMKETAEADIGPVKEETLVIAGKRVKLVRPAAPERLLDLETVADAYAEDQYMPYWAAFWPVSRYLSEVILNSSWPAGAKAIELGCGLGLPGVAALLAGTDVLFTDYDASALKFAEANARLNGFQSPASQLLDWRKPLAERFDLIIASDLIYEERNIEPMVSLFEAMLKPKGVALAADQNRPHAEHFQRVVAERGFRCEAIRFEAGKQKGYDVSGTVYRVTR